MAEKLVKMVRASDGLKADIHPDEVANCLKAGYVIVADTPPQPETTSGTKRSKRN